MYINSCFKLIGSSRENYDKYISYLNKFHLSREPKTLLVDIIEYYKQHEVDEIDWEDFRGWFHVARHPTYSATKHKMFDKIIDNIVLSPDDHESVTRLYQAQLGETLMELGGQVGTVDVADANQLIVDTVDIIEDYIESQSASSEDNMVDMDVVNLVNSVITGPGIEWRVENLNLSVGQVHPSDFIIVGKRPETGGTTFLTSEFSHMLDQLPEGKSAIIFNNEEGGSKIGLRVVQSALNLTAQEIEANPIQVQKDYIKFLNGRNIYICDKPGMTTRDIEAVLKKYPDCWLVGLNVLDKIGGFYKESEVDRFRKLAEWGRNISKGDRAVVAIVQADATAEGMQYLDQSQLYGSKTGVQGEADVMIMIGRDDSRPGVRFFSIAKNKKPTTGRMDTRLRHGKFEATFDEDRGRFT